MNEAAYRKLISGDSTGPLAGLLRTGLSLLSPGYALAVSARNLAYDTGFRTAHRAGAPVISVGNLTAGGTGKTPMVRWLAQWFVNQGVTTGILSRGYRAIAGRENDEKRLLDMLCPQVPHLQHPNRVQSARSACAEYGCRLLILDDGFQHRRLARDLDLVLIDALNPWGYGRLLPRGLLREPVSGLKRADLVLVTRADQSSARDLSEIRDRIQKNAPRAPIVEVAFPPRKLVNRDAESATLQSLRSRSVAAFCGIGNPDGFREMLSRENFQVAGFHEFPDHHSYSSQDLDRLGDWTSSLSVDAVLTTRKDLVKIERGTLNGIPLWAVDLDVEFLSGLAHLEQRIEDLLRRCDAERPASTGPACSAA